jgi:hypothetical protein
MARHFVRRTPGGGRFSWARVLFSPEPGGQQQVTYRLFLRDSTGRAYMETRSFHASDSRRFVAVVLRGMRAQLRWAVDQVEFARLGLEDPTPRPRLPA